MTRSAPFSAGAVFVAVILTAAGCSAPAAGPPEQPPLAVRVTLPRVMDLASSLSYVGTVHSGAEIQLSAQVQGTVVDLPVPEGGSVRPGDPVAVLDAPDLQAAVDRVRADRDYWRAHHGADLRLVQAGAIPREQAEVSRRADLAAQASLAEAEARLARTLERSPVHGTVLSLLVETGQHVVPGQPLLVLGDARREVHIEIVQEDLQRGIGVGTAAVVSIGGDRQAASVITDIAPTSSGPARTFTVKLSLPTSAPLRWGSSVPTAITLAAHKACVTVPAKALVSREGASGIFLVRGDRALWQEVTAGMAQDDQVEVAFPWNGEDPVAISNLGGLDDGDPVYPVLTEDGRP